VEDEYISGCVVIFLDGDTYDLLLDDNTTIRVRMDGIDAPEKGMPFFRRHNNIGVNYVKTKQLNLKGKLDHHNKTVSLSYMEDGRELSREMLKAGFAWHYKQYNSDSELAALEEEAREVKRGLWLDKNPMVPWENRKLHKQGVSTKDMYEITEDDE